MITAEAEVVDSHTIRLDTKNVLEVNFDLSKDVPLDYSKPVTVVWNADSNYTVTHIKLQRRMPVTPLTVGRNAEDNTETRFILTKVCATDYQRQASDKTPELSGPISAATNTPFAIVMGTTSKDPLMRRLCEKQALAAARNWEEWQHAKPRFFKDTEISEADQKAYSLILIGGPEANAVTAAMAEKLGLAVDAEGVTLDGRRFPCRDAAVAVVRPNPYDTDGKRYVVVKAGTSAKGMFWADQLPDDVDFVIADGRAAPPDLKRPPEEARVATGVFDKSWKVQDNLMVLGNEATRSLCVERKTPSVVSAATKDARLYLADLLETSSQGSFASMRRDVNWQFGPLALGGKKYDHGIAVAIYREPCAADYDIAGAGWRHLKGTIGIEVGDPAKLEQRFKDNTRVIFTVRGDGKELYRSPPVEWNSPPIPLDVDVTGVKSLRLEIMNESMWNFYASSVDWADIRLEK